MIWDSSIEIADHLEKKKQLFFPFTTSLLRQIINDVLVRNIVSWSRSHYSGLNVDHQRSSSRILSPRQMAWNPKTARDACSFIRASSWYEQKLDHESCYWITPQEWLGCQGLGPRMNQFNTCELHHLFWPLGKFHYVNTSYRHMFI